MARFVTRIRTHVLMAKSQVVVLTYPGTGGVGPGSLGPTSPTYLTSSTLRGDSVSKKKEDGQHLRKNICVSIHMYMHLKHVYIHIHEHSNTHKIGIYNNLESEITTTSIMVDYFVLYIIFGMIRMLEVKTLS